MHTFNQVRHELHQAMDSLEEGWHALRQRAAHAMTRFIAPGATPIPGVSHWALLPAEVWEEDTRILVTLEVSGMRAGDFDIDVIDNQLVIRGEKRRQSKELDDGRCFILERAYGIFERVIHLPALVDREAIKADYRYGVLYITLPQREGKKSGRVRVDNR